VAKILSSTRRDGIEGATENARNDNVRPGIAETDNATTFRIDHNDEFRAYFNSLLVYCCLIFTRATLC